MNNDSITLYKRIDMPLDLDAGFIELEESIDSLETLQATIKAVTYCLDRVQAKHRKLTGRDYRFFG